MVNVLTSFPNFHTRLLLNQLFVAPTTRKKLGKFQYQYLVSAVVYMTFKYSAAQEQIRKLSLQVVNGGGGPAVAMDDGDFLAGYVDQPFNLWDPATYGPVLDASPIAGMAAIIARIDAASGYGCSTDPVLRSLFETAEKGLLALARERSPFATVWPSVVASMLDRLRDYVTKKSGRDPHKARFDIAKEAGFPGMDAFAAHVAQQRPKSRGKPSKPDGKKEQGNGTGAVRKH